MSSANKPNLCTSWPMVIPLISGEERIYSAKGSIGRENISGDKGQPCLVPLVKEKFLDSIPVEKMFAVGWVYNAIMAECMNPWSQIWLEFVKYIPNAFCQMLFQHLMLVVERVFCHCVLG